MQKERHIKTFFLTGGGTGGHIYPCVSILNELKKAGFEAVYYVGNSTNPEFGIVSPICTKFLDVPVLGMPRKITPKFLKWGFLLAVSILKCFYFALKFKPDAVFATGGYVSAPMVIVSNILKIPYVLHDSDACPGIVTRAFSANAKAVNLAFSEGSRFIKKANTVTNFKNPVRDEFFTVSTDEARREFNPQGKFCVLIMGGSQGAKTVNNAACGLVNYFRNNDNIRIIFQTGRKNYDGVKAELEAAGGVPENALVEPYFEKMYLPVSASDFIVSRAGSLSISEILAAKKPSLLVPYPYAAADHQRKNAREIEKTGAALYVEDKDLTAESLIKTVKELMETSEKLEGLKKCASGQILENPTHKILNLILDAAGVQSASGSDV